MTRQIIALQRDAYEYMRDYIPRAIKSESIDTVGMIADITLSENVILKIYDNDLILDLGARRIILEAQDFREIVIRGHYEGKDKQSRNCKCMSDQAYDWPTL